MQISLMVLLIVFKAILLLLLMWQQQIALEKRSAIFLRAN